MNLSSSNSSFTSKDLKESLNYISPLVGLTGDDPEPVRVDQDIYFYCSFTTKTALTLIKLLKEAETTLMAAHKKNKHDRNHITLHLNSPGGELYSGLAVYGVMTAIKVPIVVVIEGIACSAASLIAMAGTKRFIHPQSFMLVHQLSSGAASGKMTEIEGTVRNLKEFAKTIRTIYLKRTTFTEEELDEILPQDIFLNATKCKDKGLVDGIISEKKLYEIDPDNL